MWYIILLASSRESTVYEFVRFTQISISRCFWGGWGSIVVILVLILCSTRHCLIFFLVWCLEYLFIGKTA